HRQLVLRRRRRDGERRGQGERRDQGDGQQLAGLHGFLPPFGASGGLPASGGAGWRSTDDRFAGVSHRAATRLRSAEVTAAICPDTSLMVAALPVNSWRMARRSARLMSRSSV